MSPAGELALPAAPSAPASSEYLTLRLAWRNLWRNRKRTWLTAGGIAFAIMLVCSFKALQLGSYAQMESIATSLLTGHVQVQTTEFVDDSTFDATLPNVTALQLRLAQLPQVQHVLPRVEAFALVSVGERSFGAQVLGVDLPNEQAALSYLSDIVDGRLPQAADEVVMGDVLARNLRAQVGDELVVLGSGKQGGVAAMVATIVGTLSTGMTDLDRALVVAPIATVQEAFFLDDEAHSLVLVGANPSVGEPVAARAKVALADVRGNIGNEVEGTVLQVRSWQQLLPDLQQSIALDKVSGEFMYYIILALVAFTIVNSFVMTVFERTKEFGMLLAVGMQPRGIVTLLLWEALFIWALGALLGLAAAVALTATLASVGIPLGQAAQDMATDLYMPTSIYPALTIDAFLLAPLVLFFGCLLAAFFPALRVYRMRPVEAMRHV